MPLHQYFMLLLDYRYVWIPISQPYRAFGCDLISLSWFYYPVDKSSELPGRRLCLKWSLTDRCGDVCCVRATLTDRCGAAWRAKATLTARCGGTRCLRATLTDRCGAACCPRATLTVHCGAACCLRVALTDRCGAAWRVRATLTEWRRLLQRLRQALSYIDKLYDRLDIDGDGKTVVKREIYREKVGGSNLMILTLLSHVRTYCKPEYGLPAGEIGTAPITPITQRIRMILRGTILNYVIFIGLYCGQPIQQPIQMT